MLPYADKCTEAGSEMQLAPLPIGNRQHAVAYGAQQLELMQRNGWQTTFDSYARARDPPQVRY
jgi:hypothetical protein